MVKIKIYLFLSWESKYTKRVLFIDTAFVWMYVVCDNDQILHLTLWGFRKALILHPVVFHLKFCRNGLKWEIFNIRKEWVWVCVYWYACVSICMRVYWKVPSPIKKGIRFFLVVFFIYPVGWICGIACMLNSSTPFLSWSVWRLFCTPLHVCICLIFLPQAGLSTRLIFKQRTACSFQIISFSWIGFCSKAKDSDLLLCVCVFYQPIGPLSRVFTSVFSPRSSHTKDLKNCTGCHLA